MTVRPSASQTTGNVIDRPKARICGIEMSLHWTFPGNFQIDLYRAGWKSDRTFDRVVADEWAGQFAPVSNEETKFTIRTNTIGQSLALR